MADDTKQPTPQQNLLDVATHLKSLGNQYKGHGHSAVSSMGSQLEGLGARIEAEVAKLGKDAASGAIAVAETVAGAGAFQGQ